MVLIRELKLWKTSTKYYLWFIIMALSGNLKTIKKILFNVQSRRWSKQTQFHFRDVLTFVDKYQLLLIVVDRKSFWNNRKFLIVFTPINPNKNAILSLGIGTYELEFIGNSWIWSEVFWRLAWIMISSTPPSTEFSPISFSVRKLWLGCAENSISIIRNMYYVYCSII